MKFNNKALITLFILILITTFLASGCLGSPKELTLQEQEDKVKEWLQTSLRGKTHEEVKNSLETTPFYSEKPEDGSLDREIYFASDGDLKSDVGWDDLIIKSTEEGKPSLQLSFIDNVVAAIVTRFYIDNNTVDQRTDVSSQFASAPEKEYEEESLDTDSEFYNKFDSLASELAELWSKGETLSVEAVQEKYGEASFVSNFETKTNLVYLENSQKVDSAQELNDIIAGGERNFMTVLVDQEDGVIMTEFKHLISIVSSVDGGQIQDTFTRVVINKDQELEGLKATKTIDRPHS